MLEVKKETKRKQEKYIEEILNERYQIERKKRAKHEKGKN